MSGKSTRWGVLVRQLFLSLAAVAALSLIASSAYADATGNSPGVNFFNGFTINEGQSGSVSLQVGTLSGVSSGFAGTSTRRFNTNDVSYSAPGSVSGSTTSGPTGGGAQTQTFGSGALQYNLPGVYNVSFNQGFSWNQQENSSYGLGSPSSNTSTGIAGNVNVTVNNVAPVITTANINGSNGNFSVLQGAGVTLNMTATDAGSQNTSFTINGGGAGVAGGTPGSTRTSGNVGFSTAVAPGVYNQTFQATDASGANASNGPIVRQLTVLNVGPSITAARVNGIDGNGTIAQGTAATLNMSATDPGLDAINYTINGAGAGSSPSGGNSSNVSTGTLLAPGVYTQTYLAADGFGGQSGTVTRNVTVTNVAPTITSANQNGIAGSLVVLQGATVTLNMTATDPGNDTMSFTINGGGAGSTGVQAGGSTRTSADNAVQYFTPGVFTNTFQATDQYGANALNGPQTHDVTVVNVAPVITSLIASEIPNILGNGCLMFFTATSTDPGILDSAIYSWDLNGDNIFGDYVSNDPAPPWSSTTPTTLYGLGPHTIGVMVTDNWGGFDPVNGVAYLTFECLPEPSTWVAILLSGGALSFFHRRKKRKS